MSTFKRKPVDYITEARKFGHQLESGFSSAAGVKSACRTYGTLTLGSGLDMHINEQLLGFPILYRSTNNRVHSYEL